MINPALNLEPFVMFSIGVAVVLAALGFAVGLRLRYIDPSLPAGAAVVGFVLGFLFAVPIAAALLFLLFAVLCLLLYKSGRALQQHATRFVDTLALLSAQRRNRRPYEYLLSDADQEHQRRVEAICSADHDTQLRQMLLEQEYLRYKHELTHITTAEGKS